MISTLVVMCLMMFGTTQAQNIKTYKVSSNSTWSGNAIPENCVNCAIEIVNGATLTMDKNVTLQNPSFNGGTLTMTDKTLTLHTSGGRQSYFDNIHIITKGNSVIMGSAPIIITNCTFSFYGTSKFNPQHLIDITNTKMYFNDDSYFYTTGGPVNLKSNSVLYAGTGALDSKAYIYFSGPVLNIYDNSTVILAGNNNYYFNWSQFYTVANNTWHATSFNTVNCGNGYANPCNAPYLYGPSIMNSNGVGGFNSLPIKLGEFHVASQNNHTMLLTWATEQEVNAGRFEIERSTDGLNWLTAGTVKASGNTSFAVKYSFVDRNPAYGANYYRLKMIDLDETYEYSVIKTIQHTAPARVKVFPNPAQSFVTVSVPGSATVRLLNTTGVVLQERSVTSGVVSIPVQQYHAGTYFVQVVKTDGHQESSVLVIKK
jgi:hypothetical protein